MAWCCNCKKNQLIQGVPHICLAGHRANYIAFDRAGNFIGWGIDDKAPNFLSNAGKHAHLDCNDFEPEGN